VVEEITNITPASDSHGQGYVKLHLKALKGGTTRTKYLSTAKKEGQGQGRRAVQGRQGAVEDRARRWHCYRQT
jgi:hypothetical protein